MSTRSQAPPPVGSARPPAALQKANALPAAELVALVSREKRDLLLRVHRHRLRHQDLEDCYGQATLELFACARRGRHFANALHVANALEQRFLSRVHDRRRALSGRSPAQAALELAVPLEDLTQANADPPDVRAEVEALAALREDLRRLRALVGTLTADQQLVLAAQLGQVGRAELCRSCGWSAEKYRKVAQRARARLRELMALDDGRTA